MLRFQLRQQRKDTVNWGDREVALVSSTSSISIATRWFAAGAAYARPVGVMDLREIPIRDHVLWTRLAALAVVLIALLAGRLR